MVYFLVTFSFLYSIKSCIKPAATIKFIPIEANISYISSYTFVLKWICPTIQKGTAKFPDTHERVYFRKYFTVLEVF